MNRLFPFRRSEAPWWPCGRPKVFIFLLVGFLMALTARADDVADGEDEAAEVDESTVVDSAAPPSSSSAPSAPSPRPTPTVPVARASLISSTKTADFSRPVSFDPSEGGVILPNPELVYDLTLQRGRVLRVGNVLIDERNLVFLIRPLVSYNQQLTVLLGRDGALPALALRWPAPLLKSGVLEMISRTGTVLWRFEITESVLERWRGRLAGWRKALRARNIAERDLRSGLFATNLTIEDLEAQGAPFWNQKEIFRFCLTSLDGRAQTRICSGRFSAETEGRQVTLKKVPSSVEPRVLVMNENAPLKGVVPVPMDSQTGFYADLAGGESYEFIAAPSRLNLIDLADTSRPGILRVSGFGVRPAEPSAVLNPERYGALTQALGFQPTIRDERVFWAAALRIESPYLHFPGDGGGIFRQRFELAAVPREIARPHLSKRTPTGTYQDGILLRGRKHPQSSLSSSQYSVSQDGKDPSSFVWSFRAQEPGSFNRSYLDITAAGKTYKGFYEIYRGYGRELSTRASGLAAAGAPLFMAELAYNHWFESFFGAENYIFSRQRWGASLKYFKSLTRMQINELRKSDLDVATFDLKYRLVPGLWGRDETVGLLASGQNVAFDGISASMTGVGFFWARSMPKVFAGWLEGVPLLDGPKWVDLEFVFYGSSLSSQVQLGPTYALNFHGQVHWTKQVFGEAGFGAKLYTFRDLEQNKKAGLQTFYGTIGLGMRF